jgi:hypothetical protein
MKVKKELFIWIILISMATAFSFALDERQMNLLLVGIMGVIPIFLIIQFPYLQKTERYIYFLIITISISSVYHMALFRISTLLYTLMFLFTFIYYKRLITSLHFKIEQYIKILKSLLFAYFIFLIIRQFFVLINSPYIPNFILGDLEIYKLNSLAPEPSHTARVVAVLMYSFIMMREIRLERSYNLRKDGVKDIFIWFSFLYLVITMGSGFAIVLFLVFILKFLEFKKVFYLLPLVALITIIILNLNLLPVLRVLNFGKAVIQLDTNLMILADHSASIRVVPVFLYLNMIDIFNLNTWLGYGTDFSANLIPTMVTGIAQGEYSGGLFPAFFIDRGLICAITLFLMIHKFCLTKLFSFDTFFLILLIFASGLNTQIFWISILLFTTNKYFYQSSLKNTTAMVPEK